MFLNYRIINNVLCLYVDESYEFGGVNSSNKESIKEKILDYIKLHKISFNGTKVILLVSGLMIGSVILNNNNYDTNYDVYSGNNYVTKIVNDENYLSYNINEEKVTNENNNVINSISNTNNNLDLTDEEFIDNSGNKNSDTFNLNIPENNVLSEYDDYFEVKNDEKIIQVLRSNGTFLDITLNEYLIGVVAGEMPASFNIEALKVQAIVSRTYTLKLIESGRTITDDNRTQNYKDNNQLRNMWGSSYDVYYNKIKTAVYDTNNMKIKYNGSLIDAVYFSTSNGYTEDSINVWNNSYDYLKSVPSSWDTSASSFLREVDISFNDISNALSIDFNSAQEIEILSRNSSNRIDKIRINNNIYGGVELREKLKLRSTDFDYEIKDGYVKFITRGYGHGVGLSQYGANGMANSGYTYDQIIKYYYKGVYIDS